MALAPNCAVGRLLAARKAAGVIRPFLNRLSFLGAIATAGLLDAVLSAILRAGRGINRPVGFLSFKATSVWPRPNGSSVMIPPEE